MESFPTSAILYTSKWHLVNFTIAFGTFVQLREKERKKGAAERKARSLEAAKIEAVEEVRQAAAEAATISKQCALVTLNHSMHS